MTSNEELAGELPRETAGGPSEALNAAPERSLMELTHHGIHQTSGASAQARTRKARHVTLLAIQGTSVAELSIDTRAVHPEDVVVMFTDARAETSPGYGDATKSSVIVAPFGAVTDLRCAARWSLQCVLAPRANIAPLVRSLPHHTRTYFDRRPLDRAMQRFIGAMFETDEEPTNSETFVLQRLLTDMTGAVLLDRAEAEDKADTHTMLRERAIHWIAQQCADPTTTPTRAADELGISLRLLQAVFAEAGITLEEEIRRQRVRLARFLLTDPQHSSLSIPEVAKRAGFLSTETFRRSIVREFGTTPALLRRRR